MKKHLFVIVALTLLMLMVVPFAMVTSADVTLPAEPTVTNDKVVYIGYGGKGNKTGADAANFLPTDGWDPVNYPNTSGTYPMHDAMKDGGTMVVAGKGYVGSSSTLAATSSPVLFTAWDGTTDYTGTIDSANDSNSDGIMDGQGTQTGMFMIAQKKTVTFMGDVIFDKITLLDRTNKSSSTTTYSVGSTGKVVIGSEVTVAGSRNDKENSYHNPILNVEEGGYAFLHSIGFSNYTGKGVIVVGDEVKGSVDADTFADFDGKVVDKNGKLLFSADGETSMDTSADSTPAITVPEKPAATGTAKQYVVFDKTEAGVAGSTSGGDSASAPYKASTVAAWNTLINGPLANGGTIVAAGKIYMHATLTIPAAAKPIVFTAHDGTTDFTSRDSEGNIYYMKSDGNSDGQYGMFMIVNSTSSSPKSVTFEGDVIFDNIVILSRLTAGDKTSGKTAATIVVKKTLTTTSTVQFANMRGNQNYTLQVEEGAYAYLDAAGFYAYTGKGTIVIGDTIKNSVTEDMFDGFDGAIVDSQGNPIFSETPEDSTTTPEDSTTTPDDSATTPDDSATAPDDSSTSNPDESLPPVELPEKPTYTGSDQQYVVFDKTEAGVAGSTSGGDSASAPYKASSVATWNSLVSGKLSNGGKVIAAGKLYFSASNSLPDTGNPLVFTSTDGTTDFTSRDSDGNIYYMKSDGNNDGQYGMFMIVNSNAGGNGKDIVVTFNGDVIFDNIVILSRLTAGQKNKGEYPATIRITKRLHITDTVQFANMRGNRNYTLQVDEGAVAFLDAVGFDKYTGKGIIVIGDGVLNRVSQDMFEDFNGRVVDSNGNDIFAEGVQLPVYVPEEPKDAGNFKFYIAYDNNPERDIFGSENGGMTAGFPYKTSIKSGWGKMMQNQLKDGGKIVAVGKAFIPASFTFPETKDPIVFTSVDGGVNYTSRDDNGNIYYMKADGNNDGQYGMFMIANGTSAKPINVTFNGDVIFDNIVILSRLTEGQRKKGQIPATINVNKSIVIKDNVRFANMRGNINYTLNINEDAFAYLYAVGFRRYTGTGTIVVGDNLIGRVTANTFAGFKGKVVDSLGNILFEEIPTGDTFSPAFVAVIGVSALTVGAVLTLALRKKKEEA